MDSSFSWSRQKMASNLLAENASIATALADDFGRFQLQFSSVCSRHVRFCNTIPCNSSASSSRLSQLRLPYYVGRNARPWDGLSVEKRGNRTAIGLMTENKLSDRSRKEQLETRICHGLVPFHHWISLFGDSHREFCYSNKQIDGRCRQGRGNVCACFLWSPSKGGRFSIPENGEKQRKRERQLAFFALCARAMVASHMVQSPLLSFLWSNWPSMVKELSAGEQRGYERNLIHWQLLGDREHGRKSSFSYVSHGKLLLLGFILGIVMSVTLTSAVSFGVLLDSGFWLCLLCSLVYLAVCMVRGVFVAVMLVTRDGVAPFCKSLNIALQENVCVSFFQRFFGGISTLLAHGLRLNGCSKRNAQTLRFPVSSLWGRPNIKAEVLNLGRMKSGRLREVYSQLRKVFAK